MSVEFCTCTYLFSLMYILLPMYVFIVRRETPNNFRMVWSRGGAKNIKWLPHSQSVWVVVGVCVLLYTKFIANFLLMQFRSVDLAELACKYFVYSVYFVQFIFFLIIFLFFHRVSLINHPSPESKRLLCHFCLLSPRSNPNSWCQKWDIK